MPNKATLLNILVEFVVLKEINSGFTFPPIHHRKTNGETRYLHSRVSWIYCWWEREDMILC